MKSKRGLSPLITTVLLVLIVLVLAMIIILWGTSFIPEAIAKFGSPIEDACISVKFTAELAGNDISVINTGNVHIYEIGVRAQGISKTDIDNRIVTLDSGSATIIEDIDISGLVSGDEISLIPIIVGETEKGKVQKYSCPSSSWKVIVI